MYVNVTLNGTVQEILIANTTLFSLDLPLVYFPHLIAVFLVVLVSIMGYLKDRDHEILSSMIAMIGPIELISYAVLAIFSYL